MMIHYQTVRKPLNSDLQQWLGQYRDLDRRQINALFLNQLNTPQRNYIRNVYSWSIDRNADGYSVLLTVTNEKQATLAHIMF